MPVLAPSSVLAEETEAARARSVMLTSTSLSVVEDGRELAVAGRVDGAEDGAGKERVGGVSVKICVFDGLV